MVALGSNAESAVGSPLATLKAALNTLGDSLLQVEAVSKFYATPCFPRGAGPDYVNAAATLSGETDAKTVLAELHRVEAIFGRARDRRWGMRTLDLDLIGIGDTVLPDAETFAKWRALPLEQQMKEAPDRLILPHPRLQDRAFVLVPLAEIAPDWRHPILGQTVREMAAALSAEEISDLRPL